MRPIDCVIPVVGVDDSGAPELVGSGILIEIGPKVFLLSATHVFTDNKDTTLYYPGREGLEELLGTRVGADRDKEDVSFMLLDETTAKNIAWSYAPLPTFFIEMSDVTSEGDHYALTGFSQDMQFADHLAATFRVQRFSYTSVASQDRIYRKCGVKELTHIVIDHSAKRARSSDGSVVTPPTLHCMSGGAVWKYLGSEASFPGLPAMRLVGITIERHNKWGAAVATRINFPMEAIRSEFSELAALIPASTTLAINPKNKEG